MSTNKTFNKVQLDVKFTQATSRANLISEENISISFGKISKYFADLHSQAFTGYTHPNSFTAKTTAGFYKYTVNTNGHVTAGAALAKSDITALGIPGSNTTYTFATGDAVGQIKVTPSGGTATNYSVNGIAAGTSSGTAKHLAYYDSATSITSTGNIVYSVQNSTASTPRSRTILNIFNSNTVGNDASALISGTKGVLSYGDGGPQINFSTGGTIGGAQDSAIIWTDNDSAAAGASWHFVSSQTDWNVISKRFHARTGISIGTDLPNTSHNLYVNGTSQFTYSAFGPIHIVRSGSNYAAGIKFSNSNGLIGAIGMTGNVDTALIRWKSDLSTSYTILDTGNTSVTTSGSGNAITALSFSNGTFTATKGSTFSLSTHTHSNYLPMSTVSSSTDADTLFTTSQWINWNTTTEVETTHMPTTNYGILLAKAYPGIQVFIPDSAAGIYFRKKTNANTAATAWWGITGTAGNTYNLNNFLPLSGGTMTGDIVYPHSDGRSSTMTNSGMTYKIAQSNNWAMGLTYVNSGGTHVGFIGAYGTTDAFESIRFGAKYNDWWMEITDTKTTITGDLVFSTVTSTTYPAKSKMISFGGSTDWGRIYYRVDASDAGRLVLDIGDDSNARIDFAYNGTTKSYIDTSGNFSGNAYSATNVNITVTNGSTTSTNYGIVFAVNPNTTELNVLRKTNDFRYQMKDGAANTEGFATIVLGNTKKLSEANNKSGNIYLYSSGGNWHLINTTSTTSNITHTLPATSGTILNSGTTSFTQTLSSGTKIGTIKINGTSTDLYCQTNTNTDTKVKVSASTSKAYLIGTTTSPGGTAVEGVGNTGVYMTNGVLTASSIHGSGAENQSTAPTGGYRIYDCRSVDVSPNDGDKAANFYFHMTDMPDTSLWWSVLHMRGWTGAYSAWEIAGPSDSKDQRTKPLYVRTSNTNTAWGSWRKIYDTSNPPTASEVGALASTTKYAASSSVGGAATSANKLNTNAGATNRPVYFSGGVPVQCDTPESESWFKGVPLIKTDGVMEIGKIIDFHATNTSEADYDYRIETSTTAMSLIATGSSNTLTIRSPGNAELSFQTTSSGKAYTAPGIICYPLTTTGMTTLFNFGGNLVIGGGESAKTLYDNNYDTIKTAEREDLYLCSDNGIHIVTGCQTYADKSIIEIDAVGKVYLPTTGGIIVKQRSDSNYVSATTWWKGGTAPESGEYAPQIGQHNTGGDSSYPGSICILPYKSTTNPWGGSVGLFIRKDHVYIDGVELSKSTHTHKYAGSSSAGGDATNANAANVTVTDVPSTSTSTDAWKTSYGILFAQNPNTTQSNTLRKSHNLRFYHGPNGTADTVGVGELIVGNSTASGTAGNMQGRLILYSSSSSYISMVPAATSSARTITLPAATGSVILGTKGSTSYYGLMDGDGSTSGWIRATSNGFLPSASAKFFQTATSSLGTSSWYFKNSYIQYMNANSLVLGAAKTADGAAKGQLKFFSGNGSDATGTVTLECADDVVHTGDYTVKLPTWNGTIPVFEKLFEGASNTVSLSYSDIDEYDVFLITVANSNATSEQVTVTSLWISNVAGVHDMPLIWGGAPTSSGGSCNVTSGWIQLSKNSGTTTFVVAHKSNVAQMTSNGWTISSPTYNLYIRKIFGLKAFKRT